MMLTVLGSVEERLIILVRISRELVSRLLRRRLLGLKSDGERVSNGGQCAHTSGWRVDAAESAMLFAESLACSMAPFCWSGWWTR